MLERPSRRDLAWLGALVVLILAVYLPGLANEPLYDDEYLTSGTLLKDYASPFVLKARWLAYGSFVWLHALAGDSWWVQRLVNIAIHSATVVTLWAFYREILRHVEAPKDDLAADAPASYGHSLALTIAIGVFALNPVAVYAVAYLIQRSILLATFFVVLALWLFARGLAERKALFHGLAVVAYALGVLSKEYAILAPLAAIPVYIIVARPPARRLGLLALGGALLVGLTAWALAFRYGHILGKPFDVYSRTYMAQLAQIDASAEKNAFPLSIVNEAYLFFHYGLRWMFPYEGWLSISLRPPFPLTLTSFPQVLGPLGYLAVVVGGFYLVIRYRTWPALLGLALLLPALLYPTEFSTVWVQDPFVLYRSYLWAIGIPGLVFVLIHGPSPRALIAIGGVLAIVLAAQALERVFSLSTPEKAWSDAIAKLPTDPRAVGRWFPFVNRGSVRVDHDQFELALRDFEISDKLGDMGIGASNMASLLSARGKHREALAALERAEKQGYSEYNLYFQRGLALAGLGRGTEAIEQFQKARSMNPPSPTRELALLHIGRISLQLGKHENGISALEELAKIDPKNRDGRSMLATAYVMKQDYEKARAILDPLIEEEPTRRSYYARALANYGLKRKDAALADIENAMRRGPDDPHLREWHARIRAMP